MIHEDSSFLLYTILGCHHPVYNSVHDKI